MGKLILFSFAEMYQQFLPKSFCPFLSKPFPQLKFESIRRMIDQDLSLTFNENISMRSNSDADILKLLKNLNENIDSKDIKNKELENHTEALELENERLKDQLKQRVLNVSNLRK